MRVPIAHDLPREEVRRRLHSRSHEIGKFMPGMAEVETGWPGEDEMTLNVRTMGQAIDGRVLIEDNQVVFEIDLPPALSFVEPIVAGAIQKQGQKLLTAR